MARRWKVLLVSCVGAFLAQLDVTIVNIAFPDIQRTFEDASLSGLSWVLNAYNIVFAALLVPTGRIADVIGRKRVFQAGLVVFTAASVACALAPSAELLVAARVLQAVGAAAIIPVSVAFLLAEFPLDMRATAVGLWVAAGGVAAATGPALGGVLVDWSSWRLVFVINVPLGLLAWLWGRRLLAESRREAAATLPDFQGVALVTAVVGLLALGIVQGPDWGWTDPRISGSFVAALLLAPLFVRRSLQHPSPVVDMSLFRMRSLAVANVGSLLFSVAFFAMLLCHVLFLTSVWGYSVLVAGLAMSPAPLFAAISAGPAGRVAARFGQRIPAAAGTLVFALGNLWLVSRVGTEPDFVGEWLPGVALTGLGVGVGFSALGSAALFTLPSQDFAVGSALNSMFRQIGAVLGVAVLVAIVGTPSPAEAPGAFDGGWLFAAIVALGACAASLALGTVRASANPFRSEPASAVISNGEVASR